MSIGYFLLKLVEVLAKKKEVIVDIECKVLEKPRLEESK